MAERLTKYIANDLNVANDLKILGTLHPNVLTSPGSYSNAKDDFTLTVNSGTKTVTLSATPFTVEIKNIVLGAAYVAALTGSTYSVETLSINDIDFANDVITFNGFSRNFTDNDNVILVITGPDKGYDIDQNTMLTQEQSPLWSYYSETLEVISSTNIAINKYFETITWGNYNHGFISLLATDSVGCSVKIYTEVIPDSTVPATGGSPSNGWIEITDSIVDVNTTNQTQIKFYSVFDNSFRPDRLLIEYEFTSATNAIDAYIKKWY
jgi:hypothetical protein